MGDFSDDYGGYDILGLYEQRDEDRRAQRAKLLTLPQRTEQEFEREALKQIAEKLRRAGATLPAPELTGTIEGSVVTGLCIALVLVESEIEALKEKNNG
jgi:hypothetical protein